MSSSGTPPISRSHDSLSKRGILPRHGELTLECRKMLMSRLSEHLTGVFAQVDDTLFHCAEKAENNQVQTLFFDSMRDIRKQRPIIERTYHQLIAHNFDNFLDGKQLPRPETAQDAEHLSLVQNEEYEESLLVTNMVSRIKTRCAQPLFGLEQRLALLNGGQKLADIDNPFGPQAIAQAFRDALEPCPFPLRIKTILYVLFDQHVMQGLDELYESINKRLIDAGILPNLKYSAQKQPSRGTAPTPQDSPPATPAPGDREATPVQATELPMPALDGPPASDPSQLFRGLSALLVEQRQRDPQALLLGDTPSIASFAPPTATRTYSAEELLEALDRLQQQSAQDLGRRLQAPQQVGAFKADLHGQLAAQSANPDEHRLGEDQADVIDLVGMLFDFILDDDNLPQNCKTLLSHLHTPYLKVALQDKALFTHQDHPARRLLNGMAQAGVRYGGDEEDNGLLAKMHWVVEQVIQGYQQGGELFDELLVEFTDYTATLRNKVELRERRAVEAAKGRDRLLGARQQALETIAQAIGEHPLPTIIRNFLEHTWTDVLVFILLRHGTQSSEWQRGQEVAEQLAWSGMPQDSAGQRKLQEIRRPLLDDLRKGLELLGGYHEDGIRRLLQDIVACQHAVQAKQPALAAKLVPSLPDSPLGAMLGEDSELLNAAKPSGLSSKAQALVRELAQLEFGTWFEFIEGNQRRTLKLSWFSPTTRNYMFVDHSGQRVAIKPITLLASEMEAGLARIIQPEGSAPLMDRALGAIFRVLQRITGRTPAPS